MRLVWQLLAVAAVSLIGGQAAVSMQENPWITLVIGVLTAVVGLFIYGWLVRRTEHRPSIEVSLRSATSGLVIGTLLGIALFGSVIVNIAFLEFYEVDGWGSAVGPVGLFGLMAAAAVTEELLFRGVLFRIIEERTGTWIAMALTGLLFGAYHLLNPDASLWGAVAIAIEAGGMLTAAFIATRKLWVPIGLHFGWNFAAAGIFSTVVSGNGSNQGILDATMSGPALITGGEFGPEGSLYSVLFCALAALGFLWLARRRGNIRPRRRAAQPEAATMLLQ